MQSFGVGTAAEAREFKSDNSIRVFYKNCMDICFTILSHFSIIESTALFHPVQLFFEIRINNKFKKVTMKKVKLEKN